MMLSAKPILLVEDDDVDAMTTQRALKDINVTNELVHKVNGEEAMEYFKEAFRRRLWFVTIPFTGGRQRVAIFDSFRFEYAENEWF